MDYDNCVRPGNNMSLGYIRWRIFRAGKRWGRIDHNVN